MTTIGIAGGTSPTLGRSITHAIQQTANTPIILSRLNSKVDQPERVHGTRVRYVDYTSHESLVAALSDVDTVISVLKIPSPDWTTYQINLLRAAEDAGCKRFAPAEFGLGSLTHRRVDILELKLPVWDACKESKLEVARFQCDSFMNYLSLGLAF